MTSGDIFSYIIDDSNKLTRGTGVTEQKAQIIQSSEDIIVYASNKQVVIDTVSH